MCVCVCAEVWRRWSLSPSRSVTKGSKGHFIEQQQTTDQFMKREEGKKITPTRNRRTRSVVCEVGGAPSRSGAQTCDVFSDELSHPHGATTEVALSRPVFVSIRPPLRKRSHLMSDVTRCTPDTLLKNQLTGSFII